MAAVDFLEAVEEAGVVGVGRGSIELRGAGTGNCEGLGHESLSYSQQGLLRR